MNMKKLNNAMEQAMPAFPEDCSAASERRFGAPQMQAYAFKAMENLISIAFRDKVTLSAHQLKAALDLAWPDGESDPDQGETVVTLEQIAAPFTAHDEDGETEDMPAGLYLNYDDMPEAGIYLLEDVPPPAVPHAGIAQDVHDAIGNEIFAATLGKLGQDPATHVVTSNEDYTTCVFKDGSLLVFSGGFAQVYPPREGRELGPAVRICTMTGIDECTDLNRVWALSKRYPFAEWGVLYSDNRAGTGRYPQKGWIEDLTDRIRNSNEKPAFALHICGAAVDRFLNDPIDSDVARLACCFGRIQLNRAFKPRDLEKLAHAIDCLAPSTRVIVQVNRANAWVREALRPYELTTFDALFDLSGGRGESPEAWESVPVELAHIPHGYAGGLGPDNLVDELLRIQQAHGPRPLAIDMEGSLRQDDVFQMDRADEVLRICANANFHR